MEGLARAGEYSDVAGRAALCGILVALMAKTKERRAIDLLVAIVSIGGVMSVGSVCFCLLIVWLALREVLPQSITSAVVLPSANFSHDSVCLTLLTSVAIYLRCFDLSDPRYLIFDEVHFGKFMNGHITGEFYFDIHPPLVKLLMAGFCKLFAPWYNGEQPFQDIGEEYLPDSPVTAMRFIPALSSTLLVPTTYMTCRELGVSWWGALVSASMVLFDNLQVTEGRVLTTDTSLLLFLALSLLFHIRTEKSTPLTTRWLVNLICTGFFLGCTVSTKWIALNIVGVVGICTAIDVLQKGALGVSFRGIVPEQLDLESFIIRLVVLVGLPLIIYITSFYLWIKTTPKWGEFGPYHMSQAFQASLEGSKVKSDLPVPSFWETFLQMNHAMFTGNRDVGKGQKGHPWESWWYQWPLNLRGLACWSSGAKYDAALGNSFERHVYFLGNPFVWWFAAICVCLVPLVLLTPRKPKISIPHLGWKCFMLLLGYFSGIIPYMAVRRSCFIYHYMPPLHFIVVLAGVVLDQLWFRYFTNPRVKFALTTLLIATFGISFWYFSALSYGTPLTKQQYDNRIWREGWR